MRTGILFDLDGTLLDTLEDLCDAVNFSLTQMGYPLRSLEEICGFIGGGTRNLIVRAVPSGGDADQAFRIFQSYYDTHCRVKTRPYAGIPEAMDAIARQYPVAIVSNKPDSAVKQLCRELFPGIYALGETPDRPRKPAPDMVNFAMEQIGVDTCVYVGDSEVDIRTAKNSGVCCLSVLWGFRSRSELEVAGAEYFCQEPHQLPQAVADILSQGLTEK